MTNDLAQQMERPGVARPVRMLLGIVLVLAGIFVRVNQ
jgi:hypothetical protein